MSQYEELTTTMTDQQYLVEALTEMGYKPEVQTEGTALRGYGAVSWNRQVQVTQDAFDKTGLKPPAPYVDSHILRHSLATNLAQRGAPLEEIGDMLRHRSRASTMIYARLDTDGLRSIALPWPVKGGAR